MSRHAGKDLVVMVENSSSSEVALTFARAATVTFEHEENETRGDTNVAALAGQLIARVEVEYEWDTTATTGNAAVLSGILGDNTNPRMVRVRPIGSTASNPEFSMDSVLLTYNPEENSRQDTLMGRAVFVLHANATADPAWGTVSA
jgi:hypothetical protein